MPQRRHGILLGAGSKGKAFRLPPLLTHRRHAGRCAAVDRSLLPRKAAVGRCGSTGSVPALGTAPAQPTAPLRRKSGAHPWSRPHSRRVAASRAGSLPPPRGTARRVYPLCSTLTIAHLHIQGPRRCAAGHAHAPETTAHPPKHHPRTPRERRSREPKRCCDMRRDRLGPRGIAPGEPVEPKTRSRDSLPTHRPSSQRKPGPSKRWPSGCADGCRGHRITAADPHVLRVLGPVLQRDDGPWGARRPCHAPPIHHPNPRKISPSPPPAVNSLPSRAHGRKRDERCVRDGRERGESSRRGPAGAG
jgi:hypothetical protein